MVGDKRSDSADTERSNGPLTRRECRTQSHRSEVSKNTPFPHLDISARHSVYPQPRSRRCVSRFTDRLCQIEMESQTFLR